MVVVHSHPLTSSAVMDEPSFYRSLHELKLQLDRMNQRTASLLRRQNQPASVPFAAVPDESPTPVSPELWRAHNFYPDLDCSPTPDREPREPLASEADVDAHSRKLLEYQNARVKRLYGRRDDEFARDVLTPPSSPGSAVHDSEIPRPTAGISEVGYFDPDLDAHISQIPQEFHHLYTSSPMTFVARLRRTSRTRSVPAVDQFLKGAALRWYNIGLRRDGSHWYDVDGEFRLETFCDSLLVVFGCTNDDPIIDKGSLCLVAENSLVEDYAFPALEWAQYQSFPSTCSLINSVHDIVRENANLDKLSVFESVFNRGDVAEYLASLRHFENSSKVRAKEEALAQQQHGPGTSQPPGEDESVTPKASNGDIRSANTKGENRTPGPVPQHATRQSIFNPEDFIRGISSPSDSALEPQKAGKPQPPAHAGFDEEWCEQKSVPMSLWADDTDDKRKSPRSPPYSASDARRKQRRDHPSSGAPPWGSEMAELAPPRRARYEEWRDAPKAPRWSDGKRIWREWRKERFEHERRDGSPYARVPNHARSFEDSYSYLGPTHAYAESADSDAY